ncbi:hypothetical protein N7474_006218 [Penicillium riverlandense]|uniref:uncharacterized protein n=1 Tax=Penicillium riverlandense TaxID=1903569 RepID=UPI002549B2EE|nr:uncharacterized protein N7474_006218 [Penicillium riverlandense]KAJ5820627.1 hypothetical protein N7474_006218 [Penicillium riverlandense]
MTTKTTLTMTFTMNKFEILQYNVNKSQPVMASFLRDDEVLKASIIAVQEPWRNTFSNTTQQPASASFQLLYPKTPDDEPPGVCLYVSKELDPREWSCQLVNRDYQISKLRKTHRHGEWTDLQSINQSILHLPDSNYPQYFNCPNVLAAPIVLVAPSTALCFHQLPRITEVSRH